MEGRKICKSQRYEYASKLYAPRNVQNWTKKAAIHNIDGKTIYKIYDLPRILEICVEFHLELED